MMSATKILHTLAQNIKKTPSSEVQHLFQHNTACIMTMKMEQDTLLKLVSGDHHAFKQIFRTYYMRVYSFANGFLKDTDEAEEVAQMVFVKIWDKREKFRNVNNFDSYLFTLTKYTVFNFIEAKHTTYVSEDEIPDREDNVTPYDNLIASDLQLLIDMTVENMPHQRKQVFRMSRKKGMSNEKIANTLGIQKKTVENHLNLALKELKSVISFSIITHIMLIN